MKGNRNRLLQDLQCFLRDSKKVLPLYKYSRWIWSIVALINPSIGSKNLAMGKLKSNGRERADIHSHAGIVSTEVSRLWDWFAEMN